MNAVRDVLAAVQAGIQAGQLEAVTSFLKRLAAGTLDIKLTSQAKEEADCQTPTIKGNSIAYLKMWYVGKERTGKRPHILESMSTLANPTT